MKSLKFTPALRTIENNLLVKFCILYCSVFLCFYTDQCFEEINSKRALHVGTIPLIQKVGLPFDAFSTVFILSIPGLLMYTQEGRVNCSTIIDKWFVENIL